MSYGKSLDSILTRLRAYVLYKSYLLKVIHDCKNKDQITYFENEIDTITEVIKNTNKYINRIMIQNENKKFNK